VTPRLFAYALTAALVAAAPALAQVPDPHAEHVVSDTAQPSNAREGHEGHGGHEGHEGHDPASSPAQVGPPDQRSGHVASAPPPPRVALPTSVPPVTAEMRAAAFPPVDGHAAHDRMINGLVLFDQLEGRFGSGSGAFAWSNSGWVGGDINRLWFRTEGDGADGGGIGDAEAHLLYGRAVARWWDVVAGVRQDFQPGAQTWLALGVQGLAPGFFEIQATAYVSDAGQTAARVELEYDVLLTNRLVLQPVLEVNLYGKTNESLGVGRGLSTGEAGFRLRYEFRREFAPYVGVTWVRAFGKTADLADDEASTNGAPRLVTGVRLWF
jgi:copper resistance protein B